jgi:hypothetical protein
MLAERSTTIAIVIGSRNHTSGRGSPSVAHTSKSTIICTSHDSTRRSRRHSLRLSLSRVAAQSHQPGLTVVISDFYDMEAFEGLNLLRFRKHDPVAIQVIDPIEADPRGTGLRGDVMVVDCEGGLRREITVSPKTLDAFAAAHERFCHTLETSCRSRGIHYVRANIDVPFDDLVLRMFRQGGILL